MATKTPTERIKHYNKRLSSLKTERTSFMSLWRELSDFILGYRGRYTTTDRNKGHKRNTKQINDTAARARRTLASGMMAGMSSPSRPWFRLGTPDRTLRESGAVKQWLQDVQDLLFEIFAESNFYNVLAQVYPELGTFGTAAMAIFNDFENVIRCRAYTIGSYMLANDGHGIINTFCREYQLRVSQVVEQFGFKNCTPATQNNWNSGATESWVDIVHFIEPNDNRDMMVPNALNMPFRSVYYEHATAVKSGTEGKFLRESGFEEFPIMAPRWDVTDEDVYATECPGMTALGGSKALQVLEKKKAQAVDKLVDPPLQAPSEMKGQRISLIPGEVSYVDTNNPQQGIKPIYEISPELGDLRLDVNEIENRIKSAYFEDLFLMFANIGDRERVTAEEIIEKKGEKLLMLGPMLTRSQTELFDKIIDRTFNIALRAGIVPDPPPEMEGKPIKVEYIGVLATAQKSSSITSIERVAAFATNLAQVFPAALDKIDEDQMVDEFGEAIGAPVGIIIPDDEVEEIREQREQQQRMQAALAAAGPATDAAKSASETDTTGPNLLTDARDALAP